MGHWLSHKNYISYIMCNFNTLLRPSLLKDVFFEGQQKQAKLVFQD